MNKLVMTLIAGLSASTSPGFASTFDVIGVTDLTGTVTIDSGSVTAADLQYASSLDFTNIAFQSQGSTSYSIDLKDGSTAPFDVLLLSFSTPAGTLVGFDGGAVLGGQVVFSCTADLGGGGFSCPGNNFTTLVVSDNAALTATPLPATLPLFATGLGALGLLGWRRKRKAQAVA